ncbi:MAG: uracil-DNA glycosylase [Pseudomonadota bacterium]
MSWTDRQRAMLAEMGLAVWQAPSAQPGGEAVTATRPEAAPVPDEPSTAAAPVPAPVVSSTVPTRPSAPAPQRVTGPVIKTPVEVPLFANPSSVVAEGLDWQTLRETVAGCTACALCTGRTQTVFGAGPTQAHWLVVGEAPGEQEDRLGEPFVGKSGQLLDNMLRAIQRTRHETRPDGTPAPPSHQVYIANTVKCRPPGNRNPAAEELLRCEPYLIRQIELLRPRIILAMGRFAVQTLLRSTEPVGRLRGRVHTYQGVPLIVTYHPAYLLRNAQDKSKAWDDLCLARQVADEAAAAAPSSSA